MPDPVVLTFLVCIAVDADTLRCRNTPSTRQIIERLVPRSVRRRWRGKTPASIRIRLWGINGPERCETGYQAGRKALYRLIRKHRIFCRPEPGKIRFAWSFDRPVAICKLANGTDLAREMVKRQHAIACRQYSGTYYGLAAKRCVFKRCT